MAEQSIGALVPTKIPGLSDNADIQEALRVYHYGSYDYNTSNTDPAQLISPSIAHTINTINTNITNLQNNTINASILPVKGSIITSSSPYTLYVLSPGSDGQILRSQSGSTAGIEWYNHTSAAEVLTNKTLSLSSNSLSGTISDFNNSLTDADFVTLSGIETLSNKKINSTKESVSISSNPATGTLDLDISTNAFFYYNADASSNFSISINANSQSLDNYMSIGDSQTVTVAVKSGATGRYLASVSLLNLSATVYWQNGSAPSYGTANSVEFYTFTIVRTGSSTYNIFASVTRYA